MRDSKLIVAVNKEEEASAVPVVDLFKTLPDVEREFAR